MSLDDSLFGDDEPPTASQAPAPSPIASWQVDLLRKALDARGIGDMTERQRLIEELAGRPVESLRVLTHEEGLRLLARLGESAPARSGAESSAWEDRDEATWIDRL